MAEATAAGSGGMSFIDGLGPDEARGLRSRGVMREYPAQIAVFHEGEPSDRVVVVITGRVALTRRTESGGHLHLATRGPGDLIGELGAIDGEPRSATATALEPVRTVELPIGEFVSFMSSNPRVMLVLLRMLARRLRDADRARASSGLADSSTFS
jgi:CRP/FNR family transcriptional regulator, cyclic AMP receptor protein